MLLLFHFINYVQFLCGSNQVSCCLSVTPPTESTTHASSWRSSPSSLRGDRERRRRQDVRRHGGSHQSGAMRIRASESVNWGHAIVAQNAVQNHDPGRRGSAHRHALGWCTRCFQTGTRAGGGHRDDRDRNSSKTVLALLNTRGSEGPPIKVPSYDQMMSLPLRDASPRLRP